MNLGKIIGCGLASLVAVLADSNVGTLGNASVGM